MKLAGLIGGSYQERSLPFDAQRTINLYPVFDESGREPAALYGTPGLSSFSTPGTGIGRACFASANGRAFTVVGGTLYELDSSGTATSRGTLDQTSGNLTIVENSTQLGICDGESVYTLTYSSNAFAKVTDPNIPTASTLAYIDGYFVVSEKDSGRFYISSINDGTAWAALDFATAESSPDGLQRVINANGQLWLMGDTTTEIWTNTGASSFPFRRIQGAVFDVGILAPHSAVEVDNSLMWLGKDQDGQGIVYKTSGYSPQRISNSYIERKIQGVSDLSSCRAFTYQQDGHLFYVLTGGGLEVSYVYDLTTGIWHERAFNNAGTLEKHLAADCMFAFDRHLVVDRRNGTVYTMSLDIFSDNGTEIISERTFTHFANEDKRIRYNRLSIGVESGVGLTTGDGSDPLLSMQLSKDGARTWSDWFTATIGKKGVYKNKAVFRRLGIAEQITFRVRITDPVKRAITGAYVS